MFARDVPLQSRIGMQIMDRKVQRVSSDNDATISTIVSCDMKQEYQNALEFGAQVSTILELLHSLDVRRCW